MFESEKKALQKTIDEADKKILTAKEEKNNALKMLKKLQAIEQELTPVKQEEKTETK